MQIQMLRDRETGGGPEVTHMELFFDLVYDFGIVLLLILGLMSTNLTALTLGGMVAAILLALALMTGTPRRPESQAVSTTG